MGASAPTSEESCLQKGSLVNRDKQGFRSAPTRRVGPCFVTNNNFVPSLRRRGAGLLTCFHAQFLEKAEFAKERGKGRSHKLAGKRFKDFFIKSEVFLNRPDREEETGDF